MSKFYTNVIQYGNKILVRGHYSGKRFEQSVKYKPKHFVLSKNNNKTKYLSLDEKPVSDISFDSIKEAKEFVEKYKEVSNFPIYGFNRYAYTYIYENYKENFDYHMNQINIGTLDIETDSSSGFPNIKVADKEITAITIRKNNITIVLGSGEYKPHKENIKYIKCKNEEELLSKFIEIWKFFDLDIITGWNIETFDIPYLINRINRILSEDDSKRLSPWGIIRDATYYRAGREMICYDIFGISVIDYLNAYQKFTFVKHESYKLDYIGFVELNERKVDYRNLGYESLHDLYTRNFQLFIEYNIQDVDLVYKLNEKLGLLEQIISIAYMARVNYDDAFTSVLIWDVIIHNYLLTKNIVIPTNVEKEKKTHQIAGAYVKPPIVGMHEWVVSFDLNSLYPSLIMQYNISPETICEFYQGLKNEYGYNIEKLINKEHLNDPLITKIFNENKTFTPNGATFRKDKKGFLPNLMELMYNDRDKYKKSMLEYKKQNNEKPSEDLRNLISKSNNMQMALKILLNSAYGALTNEWFRYYNNNLGEAITYGGQLSIKWIMFYMNEYLNKVLNTKNKDYVIASHTDSLYVNFGPLVKKLNITNKSHLEITRILDTICKDKIVPYIDKCYDELSQLMNAYDQKMKMKRENIASKGIWLAKNKYILNVWNEEGVEYNKPKLKLTGVEAIKSSTPYSCRENIKQAISIIMNENNDKLIEFIENFKEKYKTFSFEEMSFPRGVNGINDYYDPVKIYQKGTPIHVRGSLLFNNLIQKHNLLNKYQPIMNGDKIKFSYLLLPNPIKENVISSPNELPKEFNLNKYLDYNLMFEKSFIKPIKQITDVIYWKLEKTNDLKDFFS